MLAQSLEKTLNEVFQTARAQGAEFIGVEDMLLGLLSDARCRELLVALGAKVEEVKGNLSAYIRSQIPRTGERGNKDVQPTLGFQRVLQRAVFRVQSSGEREVSSMNILVSLFSEDESEAVRLLAEQNIEQKDVLRELGTSDWGDVSENVSLTGGFIRQSTSHGAYTVASSQTNIEVRLDELEKKLDTAISEIRELSATLRELTERPPPNT